MAVERRRHVLEKVRGGCVCTRVCVWWRAVGTLVVKCISAKRPKPAASRNTHGI